MFVDFIPDYSLDLRLIATDYDFKAQCGFIEKAVKDFKSDLIAMDLALAQETPTIRIPPTIPSLLPVYHDMGEGPFHRGNNMQLIPVKDFIRSVCF